MEKQAVNGCGRERRTSADVRQALPIAPDRCLLPAAPELRCVRRFGICPPSFEVRGDPRCDTERTRDQRDRFVRAVEVAIDGDSDQDDRHAEEDRPPHQRHFSFCQTIFPFSRIKPPCHHLGFKQLVFQVLLALDDPWCPWEYRASGTRSEWARFPYQWGQSRQLSLRIGCA